MLHRWGGFGDGGKDVGMKLEDSWWLVLNKKNFRKVICLKKTIRCPPYPLYIVDGWLMMVIYIFYFEP